jgi:hypothetical protein
VVLHQHAHDLLQFLTEGVKVRIADLIDAEQQIDILLVCLFNACFFVFFVRLFRGLGRGKIFVPGNARWLYAGAWVPIVTLIYRLVYMCFVNGCSGLAMAVLWSQSWHNLTMFSAITLMALLYDVANDVSEENQLTV